MVSAGVAALVLDATLVFVADNCGGNIWRMPNAGGMAKVAR